MHSDLNDVVALLDVRETLLSRRALLCDTYVVLNLSHHSMNFVRHLDTRFRFLILEVNFDKACRKFVNK